MDVRFENLASLHWLWLAAVLVVVVVAARRLRRRALVRFASPGLLPRLAPLTSVPRQVVRAALVLAVLPALVAAMIDPRWGIVYQEVRQRGVDILVVLDVSRSMTAEDARPDRLGRARQFVEDLVAELAGDRVGLITFAGTATVKCPLTVDYNALRLALELVSVEDVPRGGSLLGDALRLAGASFTDDVDDHKAIIVFSDGEDHGSYPVEAARLLATERGIPVFTVGIGDAGKGARIPIETGGQRVYLTYEQQEVWSRMQPEVLRAIALATGGAFIPVGTGTVDMAAVYAERIAPIAKREYETTVRARRSPQYQWFAGLALTLLLLESFIGERRVARRARGTLPRAMPAAATLALSAVLLLGAGPASVARGSAGAADRSAARRHLLDARAAMEAGAYERAIDAYAAARTALPDVAEIPFNMGVAAYRAGDLDQAAVHFDDARTLAEDPALRARSAYNLGTTAYARQLAAAGTPDAAGAAAGAEQATRALGEALQHYRETLDVDPDDLDAKANAELARRLLRRLEEMPPPSSTSEGAPPDGEPGDDQESPPQDGQDQQDQQDQGRQDQGEQGQDQRGQDQSGQDRQDQGEQEQGEQEQGEQGQDQPGQDQPPTSAGQPPAAPDEPTDAGEDEQDRGGDDAREEETGEEEPSPSAAGEAAEEQGLTREEAERLLQSVRDKERRRREMLARREAGRHPPVDKDW